MCKVAVKCQLVVISVITSGDKPVNVDIVSISAVTLCLDQLVLVSGDYAYGWVIHLYVLLPRSTETSTTFHGTEK